MNRPDNREEALFEAAIQLATPQERAAFLKGACGDDDPLRQRVEALLGAADAAGTFLDNPAHGAPFVVPPSGGPGGPSGTSLIPITEKPGDRIGRYKLLQKIGEGGCGVVYMAEQEEPVRRRVALKVIKLGMDTKNVIARFEAERQALALMDHPNIARVLDAGATETGRPYFVMELVRGIKITDYCDQNNLPTRERLALFVKVCQAIQHAHQKGIIHRDIKPSNILVTLHDGMPVPKVIDFGIVKATDQRLTDKTLFTQFESFIGTPAYMSPEQAELSGLDIDTRSDIYALGVLLYELLTSRTPFDAQTLMKAGLDEMRRTIREVEPPRPSTRLGTLAGDDLTTIARQRGTEAVKLTTLLRGDLDWIVMKALEKDRTRRYETASTFAQDIQRHLANEVVTARPPSAVYRFQKTVRRNKLAFAATGAVAAALVIGLGVSTWMFLREKEARQRAVAAEQEQAQLRQQTEAARQNEARLRRQAEKSSDENRRLSVESRERLIRLHTADGIKLIESGDVAGSLPWLAEAAKLSEQSSNHAAIALFRLRAALDQWPKLIQTIPHPEGVTHVEFSPNGTRLLTAAFEYWGYRSGARVWDTFTGRPATPLLRQGRSLGFASFSPDGKRLVLGGQDGITRVWDAATGEPLTAPIQQTDMVTRVAFSPDGARILTAIASYGGGTDRYGEARLWDAATGQPLTPPMRHNNVIYYAAISPDGGRVVTVSEDETACIWDAKTGQKSTPPLKIGSRMYHATFSPDGKRVAIAGWGGKDGIDGARVWNSTTGEPITPPLRHGAAGYFVDFSRDGRLLVSSSQDWTARIWDASTGEPLTPILPHNGAVRVARFSPDDRMVVTASDDGTARLWDAATGRLLASLRHGNRVYDAEFNSDGTLLATASEDHLVRIWDLASTDRLPLELPHDYGLTQASFSPEGGRVATVDWNNNVRIWDSVTGTCLLTLQQGSLDLQVSSDARAIFSSDGQRLLTSCGIWNAHTGERIAMFPTNDIVTVEFSSTGRKILIAGMYQSAALVLDAVTGKPISPSLGDGKTVIHHASLSPNEQFVVTAGHGGNARIWDVATGKLACPLLHHEQGLLYASFSPDSRKVATAGWDKTVRLWSVATGQQLTPPLQHKDQTMYVSFSLDGRLIATASWDKTARIWDVSTGRPVTPPLQHPQKVHQAIFSPDGKFLLTASGEGSVGHNRWNSQGSDGQACLWDVASGQLAAPPFKHRSGVRHVAFSPDGHRVLTASDDGTACLWTLPIDDRPTEDLSLLAQILSGHRMDAAEGTVALEAAVLDTGFQKLRSKYPEDFIFSPGAEVKWHERQEAASERTTNWFAVRFHLDRLVAAKPGDPSLRERRSRAQAELTKLSQKP